MEAFVCFLGCRSKLVGAGQIVGDVHTEELEAPVHLHFGSIDAEVQKQTLFIFYVKEKWGGLTEARECLGREQAVYWYWNGGVSEEGGVELRDRGGKV